MRKESTSRYQLLQPAENRHTNTITTTPKKVAVKEGKVLSTATLVTLPLGFYGQPISPQLQTHLLLDVNHDVSGLEREVDAGVHPELELGKRLRPPVLVQVAPVARVRFYLALRVFVIVAVCFLQRWICIHEHISHIYWIIHTFAYEQKHYAACTSKNRKYGTK